MDGDWEQVALGEVAINHDARRVPVRESDRKPGKHPYYGASGIVDYVDDYLFDGEYLLVAEDGENLRTRQTPIAFIAKGQFWVNNHAHILQGSSKALTKFLHYALVSADVQPFLTGAVMPKLTQANLHRIPLILPPKKQQEEIVGLLGSLDDKIDLNRRVAGTLEAMARAFFRSWFVDFDPVLAKAEGRPTGLPDNLAALFPDSFDPEGMPASWRREPLFLHANLISGGTPKTDIPEYWGGGIPWASAKDVSQCTDLFLITTERTITDAGLDNSATRLVPKMSTVVVARGATTGRFRILGRDMAMNQTCYALQSRNRRPFWLATAFADLVDSLVHAAHGSVFDTITTRTLEAVRVIAASDQLMDLFEKTVGPLYRRASATCEQSRTLAALRDTLLPKLISGELRIADAEKRIAAA
ncbi:MAG: restriction endonuclease subunit S [Stellaceae bacterium]